MKDYTIRFEILVGEDLYSRNYYKTSLQIKASSEKEAAEKFQNLLQLLLDKNEKLLSIKE